MLLVPRARLAIGQCRPCSVVGLCIWNDLPLALRSLLAAVRQGFTSHLSPFSLVVAGLGALLSRFLKGRYINAQNEWMNPALVSLERSSLWILQVFGSSIIIANHLSSSISGFSIYHSSGFSFKTYYLTSSRIHTTTHLILCLTIFTLNDNLLSRYSASSDLMATSFDYYFEQPFWFDAVLVNKLVNCA